MPWTCDATLPTAQRYASLKFRRVAVEMYPDRLDYTDAAELAAFVETVGHKSARYIFHWRPTAMPHLQRLMRHMLKDSDVVRAVQENRAAYSRAEGLAVLDAMKDGGWTSGSVPEIVRMALLDMRDAGLSQPKIAAQLGLTLDQVRIMANGPRKKATRLGLAGLVA